MRNKLFGFAAFATVLVLSQPAMAVYHVEVTSLPGVNMFQLELWADDASQLGQPVNTVGGLVQFSNFSGNIDGTSLRVESVEPLSGFTDETDSSDGGDFSDDIQFGAFSVSGVELPATADSPDEALPFVKVTFTSTGNGEFDAFVLSEGGGFIATQVDDFRFPDVVGSSVATRLSAVPEPSSFILVGLIGGLGYGCVWLRRRRANKSE